MSEVQKEKSQDKQPLGDFNRKLSWGEGAYNFIRDRVINLGVNEGIALAGTYSLVDGKYKPYCDKWSKKLAERFPNASQPPEKTEKDFRALILTVALNQGGNVLLIPMWAMEKYKDGIIEGLNHIKDALSSHKLTDEEIKARDNDVRDHLKKEPRSGLASLALSRVLSMSFNIALNKLLLAGKRTQQLETISGDLFTGLAKVPDFAITNKLAANPKFQGLSRLLLLETFYCTNTSYGMEFLDKIFRNKLDKKVPFDPNNVQIIDSDEKANAAYDALVGKQLQDNAASATPTDKPSDAVPDDDYYARLAKPRKPVSAILNGEKQNDGHVASLENRLSGTTQLSM